MLLAAEKRFGVALVRKQLLEEKLKICTTLKIEVLVQN